MKNEVMSFLNVIMPILSATLAAIIGYLVARKKNESEIRKMDIETDSLELKNMHDVVDFWKNTVKDLRIEVNQLRLQVVAFTRENNELRSEIGSLSGQVYELHKLIEGKGMED